MTPRSRPARSHRPVRLAGLAVKITTPILGAIAVVAATAPPPSWHLPAIIVLAGVGAFRQLAG